MQSGSVSALDPNQNKFHTQQEDAIQEESKIIVTDTGEYTDATYGFVQRITDGRTGRSFFYVAGLSPLSTTGAAYYLLTKWNFLHKKYKNNQSFFIMLRFNPADYKKWTFCFEK